MTYLVSYVRLKNPNIRYTDMTFLVFFGMLVTGFSSIPCGLLAQKIGGSITKTRFSQLRVKNGQFVSKSEEDFFTELRTTNCEKISTYFLFPEQWYD